MFSNVPNPPCSTNHNTNYIVDEPKLKEECGVMAIFDHHDAARLSCSGLQALQHRGQESAGIATFVNGQVYQLKGMGLVSMVFNEQNLGELPGTQAIGHVRYSTSGTSELKNAQPISGPTQHGQITLAHNGNLANSQQLRSQLQDQGQPFQTDVDTEVIYHLITTSPGSNVEEALLATLGQLQGAFSLVVMTEDRLYGIRDPHGYRPLVLGRLGKGYVLASETCALDQIGARYERDLRPGEMICISREKMHSIQYATAQERFCAFELIYFARPNSRVKGHNIYQLRRKLGQQLARQLQQKLGQQPTDQTATSTGAGKTTAIDVVIPVPDSGVPAAIGVAEFLGVPFQYGMVKNNYSGRTFILPEHLNRTQKVRCKLSLIPEVIRGQRVLVVDDSIVRGTTSQVICEMLKEAGAQEVHLAVSSPPIKFPCYYGIDISNTSKLVAATHGIGQIQKHLGVESLTYLDLQQMQQLFTAKGYSCCTSCFDGGT